MKQTALVLGWMLLVAGGLTVAAGIAVMILQFLAQDPMLLLSYWPLLLILSGMFAGAIGLALMSWSKVEG